MLFILNYLLGYHKPDLATLGGDQSPTVALKLETMDREQQNVGEWCADDVI